jgi:DNA-directed RNA polymerase subunit RPC12/RpoP
MEIKCPYCNTVQEGVELDGLYDKNIREFGTKRIEEDVQYRYTCNDCQKIYEFKLVSQIVTSRLDTKKNKIWEIFHFEDPEDENV